MLYALLCTLRCAPLRCTPDQDQDPDQTCSQTRTRRPDQTADQTGQASDTGQAQPDTHSAQPDQDQTRARQKAEPLHGNRTVARPQSAVTRPGTGNRFRQTRNQQGGWSKDLAFRFGVYRKFYICYPLVPYI